MKKGGPAFSAMRPGEQEVPRNYFRGKISQTSHDPPLIPFPSMCISDCCDKDQDAHHSFPAFSIALFHKEISRTLNYIKVLPNFYI